MRPRASRVRCVAGGGETGATPHGMCFLTGQIGVVSSSHVVSLPASDSTTRPVHRGSGLCVRVAHASPHTSLLWRPLRCVSPDTLQLFLPVLLSRALLQVVVDRESGRSKGFAFLTFLDEASAIAAIGACG